MEAEIGGMEAQAKECLEPPKAPRGKKGFSSRPLEGISP